MDGTRRVTLTRFLENYLRQKAVGLPRSLAASMWTEWEQLVQRAAAGGLKTRWRKYLQRTSHERLRASTKKARFREKFGCRRCGKGQRADRSKDKQSGLCNRCLTLRKRKGVERDAKGRRLSNCYRCGKKMRSDNFIRHL